MGDHLDQQSTAEASEQVIEIDGGYAAERHILEGDGHAAEDNAALTNEELKELERRRFKGSKPGYTPVLTIDHDYRYRDRLVAAAQRYAKAGIPVFPCQPIDHIENGEVRKKAKEPLISGGFKNASVDPTQIESWWVQFRYPDALIGLRTGKMGGGIWVLDIDMKNGVDGMAELKKLEAKFGPLPDTHTVRTPSGGTHFYFKMPDGIDLRNSASKIGAGIDVRGEGGYVIAPPSMMADGRSYEMMTDTNPDDSAFAPDWLIRLATADGSQKTFDKIASQSWAYRMLARRCEEVIGAAEGTRNETLNKAAFVIGRLVGDGALDRSAAFDTLMEAAKKAGLEEGESRKTINSGLTSGAKEKGSQAQFPDITKAGPKPGSIDNVRALLSWMGVKLRYNLFIERAEMSGFQNYTLLNDNAWAELWSAAFEYGFQPSKEFLAQALEAIALQDKYHPVKEYFESLEWDGVKRLDKLFIDYAGAEDNEYVRAVGAKTLIAAVRRTYAPGTKFDTMPVIEGVQGSGKSTMLSILAVRKEWFTDGVSLTDKTKEIIEQVEGCLIVEIQELKGMRHNEVENTKAFLSKTHDKARKAWGRFATNLGRQFVLFATTNPGEKASYLKDKTGNRRFWPVATGDEIDLASLKRDRDQLWAEAVQRHRAGESLLLPKRLWDFARAEQEKRVAQHPWVAILDEAFQEGDAPMLGKVRVEDVWALVGKQDPSRRTTYDMTDLGEAMKKLGWEHTRLRLGSDGKRFYVYVRGVAPYREITVTARFGEKPIIRYAKEAAEEEI